MPTNSKEYQKKYMRFYRKLQKEAKELRLKRLGYEETEQDRECNLFRQQVLAWLDGKLDRHDVIIEWDKHMCKCDACAEWYVSVKRAGFKIGVNLWKKKE